jgi:mannose-6-phosphate isomerase-like protein (cupin superfamily)
MTTKIIERMQWNELAHEYGVKAKRLLPWQGVTPPFGGAWVVVEPHSTSLAHVNEPQDEEEMFICTQGQAIARIGDEVQNIQTGDVVYLPVGVEHWLENHHDTACHLYCIWWNQSSIQASLAQRRSTP